METEILAWSSRYFFEDCKTFDFESWGVPLILSWDTLSCRRILQNCCGKLLLLSSQFAVGFVA